jgi:hypothetical protein
LELGDLITKINTKLQTVFKKYYPQQYVPKEGGKKRSITGADVFRKTNYHKFKELNPGNFNLYF